MKYLVTLVVIVLAHLPTTCFADITDRFVGDIYYVSKSGDDADNGSSWAEAKQTIDGALQQICADEVGSAQIWISAQTPTTAGFEDTYTSPNYDVPDGVSIFGGFDGSENNRWQRNWRRNAVTLEGQITIGSGALDGFTIVNPEGTGVVMSSAYGESFGLLSHNVIKQVAVGVRCGPCANPVITNNVITQFTATGIWAEQGLPCHISNNTIVCSGEKTGCVGIKLSNFYPEACDLTSTIIRANIITGCEVGVYNPGQYNLIVRNNNLFDNTNAGITGAGRIDSDPLFANAVQGNFQLQPTSPCIDKDDNNEYLEQLDVNCNARRVDIPNVGHDGDVSALYDIGACEYQASPVVDRGLPPASKINSTAGIDRANVRWAGSNSDIFYGGTFTLPSGKNWIVDSIRVWAIPSVSRNLNYHLGDHFNTIVLYTKDPAGSIIARCTCSLTPGNSHGSFHFRITPAQYVNGESYERADGGFDKVWQIDIGNLNWYVNGGSECYFGIVGQPRADRLWFNSAANLSPQDNLVKYTIATSGLTASSVNFLNPLVGWFGKDSMGNTKRSSVNVQVFAHRQ